MLRQRCHVFVRLVGHAAKRHTRLLGLDNTSRLAVDKEKIVAWSGGQRELSDCNTERSIAVELAAILQRPTSRRKQLVNLLPRARFRRQRPCHAVMEWRN